MKRLLIIPRATAEDWQWRQYKGYALVSGDCVDCDVVMGKAVARVLRYVTGLAAIELAFAVAAVAASEREAA